MCAENHGRAPRRRLHRAALSVPGALLWRVLLGVFIFACQSAAWSSVDTGKAWLSAQVEASGAVTGQAASVALPVQTQSETARTLATLGTAPAAALLEQIQQSPIASTEHLARYKLAADQQGTDATSYLSQISALQNADGGFGSAAGHASNAVDTAWALLALQPDRAASPVAQSAVGWLLDNQRANGSWLLATDEDGIVPTALVVQVLQHYRGYAGVSAAQTLARAWLDSQQRPDHAWGRADITAQALLALLPAQTTASAYAATVAQLEGAQLADGSWLQDPYITAVVLRALWLAAQPVTNPDLPSVRGVVVDNATGQPVAGAQVALASNSAASATTGADGAFLLADLSTGTDVLTISASGYHTLTASLQLQTAQSIDLGNVRLSAAPADSSTVTIFGYAKHTPDRYNIYDATTATISAGGRSTRANVYGWYMLTGVPPGDISIQASYSTYISYPVLHASITAVAGQQVRFDPLFTQPLSNAATLLAVVTSQETGQPVTGAFVSLNGVNQSANASGQASFSTGLRIGENTIQIAASGFEGQIIQITVPSGRTVTLPVALKPAAVSNQTILQGVVTDAATHLPLAGASVTVDGVAGMATQTDAQGRYQFSSPPAFSGNRKIIFEKPGYYSHEQSIQITLDRTHNFNAALQTLIQSGAAASLSVFVDDQGSGAPLAGATITLSGANTQSATTDATGYARINGLTVGDTQILVSAPGFQSVIAQIDVVSGRQYQLPVQLEPQSAGGGAASIKLSGTVLDATSRQPLAGAQIALTGPDALSALTDANGYYEFDAIAPGDWQISATLAGYQSFSQPIAITGATQANIPLNADHGTGDPSLLSWGVTGTIIDADTLSLISGAHIVLEEVILGRPIASESTTTSQPNGSFSFTGLTHDHARLIISLPGYDSLVVPLVRGSQSIAQLGNLPLKRSYVTALPDLQLGPIDRSGLSVDPYTFQASGQVAVEVINNSNYDAGAFDLLLFEDLDLDGQWQPAQDRPLDRVRIASGLAQ
ncbi:MAG: carboxypeptidase regulatory-like domain-containing protein [Burkholderiaceae bacterium]|jgi:protocatechuate 3,4-dioxygenase beta subunit|nr:carboxypeptidase regulatory-like domain-containing protein [Burkholderiaceae bacterium]